MKKLLLFTIILFILSLSSCSPEDIENEVNEFTPIIEQRLINNLVIKSILDGDYEFINMNESTTINVLGLERNYIIIELDSDQEADIKVITEAKNEVWALQIYFDCDMTQYGITFDAMESNVVYRVTLQKGFNIIKIISYTGVAYDFEFIANEIGDEVE